MADDTDLYTQMRAADAEVGRKLLLIATDITDDPAPSCPFFKSKIEIAAQTLRGCAAQLMRS